jgi:hypothetical protein
MGYHLEGDLLEVCDCRVLCPCWIGEDPDNGTCDTILAYRMKKGTIDGTDVAGLSLALMAHIPGNILSYLSSHSSVKQTVGQLGRVGNARALRGFR